tara:strand:+ start:173 stop:361 length:189 start_codon:yes stop_codon:yes gene_type:complete
MSDKQDKIKDLEVRIRNINNQIITLEDTKFNLMILKREIHFSDLKDVLEESWEKTLKDVSDD